MTRPGPEDDARRGEKFRVPFRRNRGPKPRDKNWTQRARSGDEAWLEQAHQEQVVPRGELSRQRTILVPVGVGHEAPLCGVVVACRGLYVDVDDGERVIPCTVRRVLRTRLIEGRHPIAVGDRVRFCVEAAREGLVQEGVIESVEPRRGQLCRLVRKRIQTIVANVDQAIIVSSAAQPDPRPNLIDRYIVSALAGDIRPVICMNKIDLDTDAHARSLLKRYETLGYMTLSTSAVSGEGIDSLRGALRGKASAIAGQSGVGKSSLLNAVHPGLELRTGEVIAKYDKGRHTTTTAVLIRLDFGGYVVDTPGIRSFDLSIVPRGELEAHFVEFTPHVPDCKFPDCTHTHEDACAVKAALHRGLIHPDRYESYVRLLTDSAAI